MIRRVLCFIMMFPGVLVADDTLSVMTFNLRYASAGDGSNAWENANQSPDRRVVARAVIQNRQPDIIGLQEGEDSQIDDLAAHLTGYRIERQKPSGGGGSENAVFAYRTNTLELIDRGVFSLGPRPGGGYWNNVPGTSFDPNDTFPENNNPFPRLALWGQFRRRATGQTLLFYSTHFDVYNGANSGTSQVKSAALITDDALARARRIPASPLAIVVGDFNSNQSDRPWNLFTGSHTNAGVSGDFTDAWLQVHGGWNNAGTFHGFVGGTQPEQRRIDWILHRGGFVATQTVIIADAVTSTNLISFQTHALYASDHYPVLAHLRFPPVASDVDRDGLPDAMELTSPISHPVRADSDGDRLLDGEEDLNGNGIVEGGETDPSNGNDTQRPTDIRIYQMDGLLDVRATQRAANGLLLYAQFDGRYLYVATQDAGEGNDHFIFIATNPASARTAPWAKAGTVGHYAAFLADENNSGYASWFDAGNTAITNPFIARAASYYQNGGWIEGVIDLSVWFGAGFTGPLYLAAAPYGNDDGGALITSAQVPAGNGDAHLLDAAEYVNVTPEDRDGDGINDAADPDADGDGLADAWERAHGLDPTSPAGTQGANGDFDDDGVSNLDEWKTRTSPSDGDDHLRIDDITPDGQRMLITWPAVYGTAYRIAHTTNLADATSWTSRPAGVAAVFPASTMTNITTNLPASAHIRMEAAY